MDVGPRIHEMALKDIVKIILKINAVAYSFEAANPRHEREYHVTERVKLPDGKILIPGVISHTTNLVEHPELVADRIVRFAKLVRRENVIAGADYGFAASALRFNDTQPSVAWLKFAALAEGARLATRELCHRQQGIAAAENIVRALGQPQMCQQKHDANCGRVTNKAIRETPTPSQASYEVRISRRATRQCLSTCWFVPSSFLH